MRRTQNLIALSSTKFIFCEFQYYAAARRLFKIYFVGLGSKNGEQHGLIDG